MLSLSDKQGLTEKTGKGIFCKDKKSSKVYEKCRKPYMNKKLIVALLNRISKSFEKQPELHSAVHMLLF